jgi:preprotein translocase subunit SecD
VKLFILLGLVVTLMNNSFAQENSTGVFMTMKASKNSNDFSKTISTRDNSKKNTVVVPLKPIISGDQFTKVSEIIDDIRHNTTYFYLSFSPEGIEKLKDITTKVEGVQLVLVVNNIVIGYIKTMSEIVNRSIQINGPTNSPDVLWAHENLKKIIENRP